MKAEGSERRAETEGRSEKKEKKIILDFGLWIVDLIQSANRMKAKGIRRWKVEGGNPQSTIHNLQ
jgi:hypothetical protein